MFFIQLICHFPILSCLSIIFSKDSTKFITKGFFGNYIYIWDINKSKPLLVLGHENSVYSASFSAGDMAYALEIGAKQLFGADKTFAYLLTSNIYDDTGNKNPTKTTLVATFEEIANKAKSTDILYQSIQSNTMVSF